MEPPFSLRDEKVIISRKNISVGVSLMEPVVYFAGNDRNESNDAKPTIIRGQLHLKTSKSLKVKSISILFHGNAQIEWMNAISVDSDQYCDKRTLVSQLVKCFHHGATSSMPNEYGAQSYRHSNSSMGSAKEVSASTAACHRFTRSSISTSSKYRKLTAQARKSLSIRPRRLCARPEDIAVTSTTADKQHDCTIFPPGDYQYQFDFLVNCALPGTVKTDVGFVRYDIEVTIERSGRFQSDIVGKMEVPVVRIPTMNSTELVDPILLSKNWKDQFQYDLAICGKSFPLGSRIPIGLKLTPLGKVKCHRIQVYVTEIIQYQTSDKNAPRLRKLPRTVLLFEKQAYLPNVSTYPGSSMRVTAGDVQWNNTQPAASPKLAARENHPGPRGSVLFDSDDTGPTEMENDVKLPGCVDMEEKGESRRLHIDSTYEFIQIHHWIKVMFCLSQTNGNGCSEIFIESPIRILSCKATHANIFPPAYTPSHVNTLSAASCECHRPALMNGKRESINSISAGTQEQDVPSSSTRLVDGRIANRLESNNTEYWNYSPPEQSNNQYRVRPMHFLRNPSYAPPLFEEDRPPPLHSSPPEYTSTIANDD